MVISMADNAKIKEDEEKMAKLVDELNAKIMENVNGRPYLLVLASLYEMERQEGKSKVAGQWNWRSNIMSKEEGRGKDAIETGKQLMSLLTDQITDALDRKEVGVKERYKLAKK